MNDIEDKWQELLASAIAETIPNDSERKRPKRSLLSIRFCLRIAGLYGGLKIVKSS